MADSNLVVYRGETAAIPFSPAEDTAITGWSLAFYAGPTGGEPTLTRTTDSGITVNSATLGTFTVTLTRSQTLSLTAGGNYTWAVWRTDSGSESVLATGALVVKTATRPTS